MELRGIEPLTSAVRLRPELKFAASASGIDALQTRKTTGSLEPLRYQCDTKDCGAHEAMKPPIDSKKKSGTLTADPTVGAPIGEMISFQAAQYRPVVPVGAGDIEEWAHFGTAVMAFGFYNGSKLRIDGSAALIGPGLALSAWHVIEPLAQDILNGAFDITAFAIHDAGVTIWKVREITPSPNSDVAIVRLNLASDFLPGGYRVATLTTRIPKIGEPVMIAGMRGDVEVSIGEPIPLQVRVGVGEVTAVYPTGRDRLMLPFPCVEVRCLTIGGMSGGPAFDKDGRLIGVLSSSFADDGGPSYVSLWWPTAATPITSCWPPGIAALPTSILKMRAAGAVAMAHPEALSVIGNQLQFTEP